MSPPRVSVLVPCFNDGKFLDEALRSVAAQSYRDFEAIVADDASTDDSPAIARAWVTRDSRFRLSRLESNIGMNRNWNRALSEARGDLVLKLDGDDALADCCLEVLSQEMFSDSEVLVAACRTLDCDELLTPLGPFPGDRALLRHGLDPESRHVRKGLEWLRLCFEDAQLWHSNAQMYRTDELLGLGGWNERWIASDSELILRMMEKDRLVVHRPEIGVFYRRRRGSSSFKERTQGFNRIELVLMGLLVLSMNAGRLRPLGTRLRRNWWRYWRIFLQDRMATESWSAIPAERRVWLEEAAEAVMKRPPGRLVRLEGATRDWLSSVRHRLMRAMGHVDKV